jgi:hypothetical protein
MASSSLIVDRARAQYDCSEQFGTVRTVAYFSCGVAGWREFQDAEVEVKVKMACVLEGKTRLRQTSKRG